MVILGGLQEDSINKRIAQRSGAQYFGVYALQDFIGLVDQCDLVVTAVTMALHIALALKKKVLLFNNIFNAREFELFGLGEIMEPQKPCKGCFRSTCDEECMTLIKPETVAARIDALLEY